MSTANGEQACFNWKPPPTTTTTTSPPSLPPSLFRCNWHDSYTSSSLSSQRALEKRAEPPPSCSDWSERRCGAILCRIVMFTNVTSRSFLSPLLCNLMMIICNLSRPNLLWVGSSFSFLPLPPLNVYKLRDSVLSVSTDQWSIQHTLSHCVWENLL